MAYWLLKTEAAVWSWSDQIKKGIEPWDGVRNYQASNNLRAMKKGDLCFFYHSQKDRQIVGVVEVVKEYYPDPSDEKKRFGRVDVRTHTSLSKPIPLSEIKRIPELQHLALVRQSRLSVMPIDAVSWLKICQMGGVSVALISIF